MSFSQDIDTSLTTNQQKATGGFGGVKEETKGGVLEQSSFMEESQRREIEMLKGANSALEIRLSNMEKYKEMNVEGEEKLVARDKEIASLKSQIKTFENQRGK